ncbi:MAG: hypothetical protein AVDCRST_MAG67-1008 [uncultured Solirubrobacteraceae bacterium]|uniref:Uncharacterized protein n=1 Tax=uncultured Solirubrobacteraceae bacterium TaxID=1162706 RepID=A0A6J4RWZ0_9ACTN|nr:MAG: hypothetical protein AVDCRST_MAG67-1008 [uncultured Solirubrobacteraceae bacterium]
MNTTDVTWQLGQGVGWRPQLDGAIARAPGLGFVEVIAEAIGGHGLPAGVAAAVQRGLQVVPHGVSLSLGGAERPDVARLAQLAAVAERCGAPLVSEHIAFVRAGGRESGHLLPVPRTREALDILSDNVAIAQEALPVPLALEHVAALVQWPGAEMDEATFVAQLIERTGALLLLDLSNLYANAHNHGYDALQSLQRFPLERIAYVHVGGGRLRDGVYHDTHADPVVPGVLQLVEELFALTDAPGVLLERDDDFAPEAEFAAELRAIADAVRRGTEQRVRA